VIREISGNILAADVEALVNPINTVGVMGAGLALQFKRKYYFEMFDDYVTACNNGTLRVGKVMVHAVGHGKYVISFPTKGDWKDPSRLEWIDQGLGDLARRITTLGIKSIAIPPLGCGLGGLSWSDVRKLIEQHLGELDVDVVLYPPKPPGGER
jgi:O-acetyl-ADP-ribose deacetylase (regulator of RNase III)